MTQNIGWKKRLKLLLIKIKLLVAVSLDAADFFLAHIPIINTLWDFITFLILLIILKNRNLAYFSFGELLFLGTPLLGTIDAFIPVATILVLIDMLQNNQLENFVSQN